MELGEILKRLRQNDPTLTQFDCWDSQFSNADATAFAEALKVNQILTQLSFINIQVGDTGAIALAEALKINQTLTQLSLNSIHVGDTGAIAIAEALKVNQTLMQLSLDRTQIGDTGAKALVEMLKVNQTLMQLSLGRTQIGDTGAKALAEMLKINQTLTQLNLDFTQITIASAKAIAESLQVNQALTVLNLRKNTIGDAGAAVIAQALKSNKALKQINLSGNAINSSGATALVEMLKINKTLTWVIFYDNPISSSLARQIKEYVANNKERATQLIQAAQIGNLTKVKTLLAQGVSVNYQDEAGNTALHFAALRNHQDIVTLLLAQPEQVRLPNINGEFPQINTNTKAASSFSAQPSSSASGFNFKAAVSSDAQPSSSGFGATSLSVVPVEQVATPSVSKLTHLQKISWSALHFDKTADLLAQGAYGDVYQGKWNGIDVAIKLLHLKKMPNELLRDFEREADIMAQCLFPSIVRLYGVCIEPAHYTLVMEYLAKGSLYEVLQDKQTELTWSARWDIALDIAKGLAYLHEKNILHRDIKSMNVLVGADGHAKITDFGLSRIKIETSSSSTLANKTTGSIRWRAPEFFAYKATYTSACDIYSLGMVLWEIAARTLPFAEESDDQMVISWVKSGVQQDIPADCPPAFAEIIKSCLLTKPEARPTAQQLVETLEKTKPQVIPDQLPLKELSRSWYFSDHLLEQAQEAEETNGFALLPAGPEDIGKVFQFYSHHPVPGYDLKRVEVIYNRGQNQIFERRMRMLEERAHPACAAAFAPKWSSEYGTQWRTQVDKICHAMTKPYQDSRFPNVQLLPLWHGTNEIVLESLLRTGYANLATTDSGFFGKGIYSTAEAEYAHRVYSKKGPLVLNWVAFYSAYPTIDGDMGKLMEKGNYQNYDAHFVPVVPASNKPNEVIYYPSKLNQKHTYTELVVFDPNQCLPRYLVELQPILPQIPANLGGNPHTLFYKGKVDQVVYVNLLAAAKYVYENYLSKPYTLRQGDNWQLDWEYRHPSNGKIIPRPNHGLAHSLRKVFYAPLVVEHYIAHQQLSGAEVKQLKNDINVIQLALLFFISGRENDLSSVNNEANFHRFRQQSADNFERYVQDAGIKLNLEKVALYKQALLWFQGTNDQGYLKHIRFILWQCHFIDLVRCLTVEQFAGSISYVDQQIGQLRREQLVRLAEISIKRTGDRLLGTQTPQSYQSDLFVEASSSVEKCMQYLQAAWREFEESLQVQVVASSSAAVAQLAL